jgi:hypothetical protein
MNGYTAAEVVKDLKLDVPRETYSPPPEKSGSGS